MTRMLGFVGVGAMGSGMCKNLTLKSGHTVLAADSSSQSLQQMEQHGVQAATIQDIARQAEIVFLSLPSINEVESVCLGPDGLCAQALALKIIVDMSTSDVTRTRALAQKLQEKGLLYLDAPVARSREAAQNGTLLITVGGAAEVVERVKPYLECMATDVVHCGDIGTGQTAKIMNNMVLLCTVNALAEAFAIAEQAGMSKDLLCRTLSLGSANSFGLTLTGENYLAKDTFPEKMFSASYALKDMKLALSLAQDASLSANIAQTTADNLNSAVEKGLGDAYYPVIYRMIRDG